MRLSCLDQILVSILIKEKGVSFGLFDRSFYFLCVLNVYKYLIPQVFFNMTFFDHFEF